MRFILLTVLVSLFVVFLSPFLPYWVVMIGIGILGLLVYPSTVGGFFGGGLGMGAAWFGQTVYIGILTSSALPEKVGELMGLGSNFSLGLLTGLLGFLLGAFSGLSGVLGRKLFDKVPGNN
jgi:hypothetical protein